jgi:hypothetical protein
MVKYLPRKRKKAFVKRYGRDAWRIYENMGSRVKEIRERPIQTIREAVELASTIAAGVCQLHHLAYKRASKRRPVPGFPHGSYGGEGIALVGEHGKEVISNSDTKVILKSYANKGATLN